MKNGYRVIDIDGHVLDTAPDVLTDLQARLPSEHRSRAPQHIPIPTGGGRTLLEGEIWYTPHFPAGEDPGGYEFMLEKVGMYDPARRVSDLDREGIDVALLFGGSLGLGGPGLKHAGFAAAFMRAYNDWLASFCSAAPDRLRGVAALPMVDGEAAAAELRRAVEELAFAGACVPSNLDRRPPDQTAFRRVYREAQELDVPVFVHATSAPPGVPALVWDHCETYLTGLLAQPIELMVALPAIAMGGILDEFPQLRLAFLEGNASWLPFWLERADEYFELFRSVVPARRRPSEYFQEGRIFLSCSHDEPHLDHAIEVLGDDWLLYNSDYWHVDAKFPGAVDELLAHPSLSEGSKRKILAGNAERLLGEGG